MSDTSWSQENLPKGKNRCPRCNKIHDIESSKIAPPKKALDPGQAALQAYMEKELGGETAHLRCPHCGTTYMLTANPDAQDTGEGPTDTRLADTLNSMSGAASPGAAATPEKSGCFVATACYGSSDCPEVLLLRQYRDEHLLPVAFGNWLVRVYYRFSPPVADLLRRRRILRDTVRMVVVAPLVRILRLVVKSTC